MYEQSGPEFLDNEQNRCIRGCSTNSFELQYLINLSDFSTIFETNLDLDV